MILSIPGREQSSFTAKSACSIKRPKGEKMTTNCAPPPQTFWVWYQLWHGFGKDERIRDFFYFFLPAFVFSSVFSFLLEVCFASSRYKFISLVQLHYSWKDTHTHIKRGFPFNSAPKIYTGMCWRFAALWLQGIKLTKNVSPSKPE